MKKILLMAAFAVASLTANAQFYVGGSLGFQAGKAGDGADNVTKFQIAPEVGYNVSEDLAVGIALGFQTYNGNFSETTGFATNGTKYDKSLTDFVLNPYVRYAFYKTGSLSLFVDGTVKLAFRNQDRGMVAGVGLRPGLKFAASEKIDLVATMGFLGYQWGNKKAGKPSTFGLGVDNTALSFGAYYNF